MLSLEQIKLLESKVEKAIQMIKKLTDERNALKVKIVEKNKRISELENMVVSFKDDQTKIEAGVLSALNLLSAFEDSSTTSATASVEPKIESPVMSQKEKDLADILGDGDSSEDESEIQPDIF